MVSSSSQGDRSAQVLRVSWAERLTLKGKSLFPGLLAAVTVAIAARFLSEHYAAPTMFFALLLGMGFHFLSEYAHPMFWSPFSVVGEGGLCLSQ